MKFFKRFINHTCGYYTIFMLIFMAFAAIRYAARTTAGNQAQELFLTVDVCAAFILFAALLGICSLIFFAEKKIGYLYTVLLHFLSCTASFVVFYKVFTETDFSKSSNSNYDFTRGVFVGVILFVVLYAITITIFSLIRGKLNRSASSKQEYTPMFSSKDK